MQEAVVVVSVVVVVRRTEVDWTTVTVVDVSVSMLVSGTLVVCRLVRIHSQA